MENVKRYINIPIEALRSVVTVADTGSQTKAASRLGLSQPALSIQLKKLERLVGESIFEPASVGSGITEFGKLVIVHARKIIEANDQLLLLRGGHDIDCSPRLGLSSLYAQTFFQSKAEADLGKITMVADHSSALLRGMIEGIIDIALLLVTDTTELDCSIRCIRERIVPLGWVRSENFVLGQAAPIPLVAWPGQATTEMMIRSLEEGRRIYEIAFASPDHNAALAAVQAGTGYMVWPSDIAFDDKLVQASEYYLPKLRPLKLLLCERLSVSGKHPKFEKFLIDAFFSSSRDGDRPPINFVHNSQFSLEASE